MAHRFFPVDYLAIGHVTEDITPQGTRLGGTVTYAGLTAHAFGKKVGVLTAAASDTDLHALDELQVHVVPSETTSTFQNIYEPSGRRQVINSRAADIKVNAMPASWSGFKIVHCGPVASEVDRAFCELSGSHATCLTPQGWLRGWDEAGHVTLQAANMLHPYMNGNSIVVLSLEDIGGTLEAAGEIAEECLILAITLGSGGAMIYAQGEARLIKAPAVDEIDATGCGDIFAASFFISIEAGKDPFSAAVIANQLGAIAATRTGLDSVPRPHESIGALRMRT